MALPQAIDIRISMLRLAPQCFAFTSFYFLKIFLSSALESVMELLGPLPRCDL